VRFRLGLGVAGSSSCTRVYQPDGMSTGGPPCPGMRSIHWHYSKPVAGDCRRCSCVAEECQWERGGGGEHNSKSAEAVAHARPHCTTRGSGLGASRTTHTCSTPSVSLKVTHPAGHVGTCSTVHRGFTCTCTAHWQPPPHTHTHWHTVAPPPGPTLPTPRARHLRRMQACVDVSKHASEDTTQPVQVEG
jgi:hypothetical protein